MVRERWTLFGGVTVGVEVDRKACALDAARRMHAKCELGALNNERIKQTEDGSMAVRKKKAAKSAGAPAPAKKRKKRRKKKAAAAAPAAAKPARKARRKRAKKA
jgi:hypothetical protein